MNSEKILDISWGTIIKIGIAFLVFYILYLIRGVLVWIIFSLIISVLFEPAIDFLQKKRIPRFLATILIYVIAFGIFGFSIYLLAPVFFKEIQQFSQLFSQYFEKLAPPLKGLGFVVFENFEAFIKFFQDWLVRVSSNILSATASIFGGIFSTIIIFSIAFFLSIEEKGVERVIGFLAPKNKEAYILNLWEKCQNKVSGWFGVRILSCLFIGLMTFLTCQILKIKYAVTFSFLAGIFDIIPIIGPIVAGIIIFISSFIYSPWRALFFLIAFILIQQIEGNILTPILAKKFIGLPPVLVLISVIVGGKLWGILGAILTIPLVGIIFEFSKDFLKKRKEVSVL